MSGLRAHAVERIPPARHTHADASDEAVASSAAAIAREARIRAIFLSFHLKKLSAYKVVFLGSHVDDRQILKIYKQRG
jgi:hypothetical protein